MRFMGFIAAVAALGIALAVSAATVRPMSLDEVVDSAELAFHGLCIGNRVEHDAATGLIVTVTTFAVRDPIKGRAGATHEIKQIGGILPGGTEGLVVRGVPSFVVGTEYVVFLPGRSSLGFSSPVGLSQGQYAIHDSPGGKHVLERAVPTVAPAADPVATPSARPAARLIALDEFKRSARARATARE